MRHIAFAAMALFASVASGQIDRANVEASIDLRLDMASAELSTAHEFDQLEAWVFVAGWVFAAADRFNNRESDDRFATGVMAFSVCAYVGIRLAGDGHRKRAAIALSRRR